MAIAVNRTVLVPSRGLARRHRPRPQPKVRQPDAVRVQYLGWLLSLLRPLEEAVDEMVAKLLPIWNRRDAADPPDTIDRLSEEFFRGLSVQRQRDFLRRVADAADAWSSREFGRQVRAAFGVDYQAAIRGLEGKVRDFTEENISLIKSVPTRYLDDVEKTITRGIREGRTTADIASDVQARGRVSESQAKLIARDQVGTFFGSLMEARNVELGVAEYIWRTVEDERVRGDPTGLYPTARPSHFARNGQRYRWNRPPEGGHPGVAVNCRCYAEPVFPDED